MVYLLLRGDLAGDSSYFTGEGENVFMFTTLDLDPANDLFESAFSDFISSLFLITSSSNSIMHFAMYSSIF